MSAGALPRLEIAWALGAALALALALLALRPAERRSVRNALLLLGACAIAVVAIELTDTMGAHAAAALAAEGAIGLAGIVLLRLAVLFVFRVVLEAAGARPANIVEELTAGALYLAWGLLWLRLEGVDPGGLVATSAVITAVVAISMQHTLGNVLGGVVLQFDRSLRTGDWLRLDDATSGVVVDVTWRHTSIETRNGETVVIPNGWLIQNRFTVIGSRGAERPLWRRVVRINVDLEAPPSRVIAALEAAVRDGEIAHVAPQPEPTAVLLDFGPRHGAYALRYWLDDPRVDDPTDSQVRAHMLAAIERNEMRLGVPFQEQFDVRDDEGHRAERVRRERDRRIAALGAVELFAPLTPAERESLAGHLVYAPFVAGDVMTRQGATAHWLYLMVSGSADVWIDTPGGRKPIATLEAGSVFGEMGMMTGEPRRASVGARTDVVCYRLDKSGFAEIIRARPDVADAMAHVLARREVELEERRSHADMSAHAAQKHADIHARIRAFFGLA
ncbi:MAG TPA: mechanosensitive ion channel family protein [Usitatibacter sp.]|nr:mechanosensitive ion channel family protein [Usitatibacter sp.]